LKVLAFDTATTFCSIVVWHNQKILAEQRKAIDRGHAEVLVPLIEATLLEAKLNYQELDLLAVTTGPGAFTGLRIGLSTARSLALACDLPLIGITNFEALANAIPKTDRRGYKILIVLETKRSDFYICLYDENLAVLIEPQTIDGPDLELLVKNVRLLIAGDAIERALPFVAFPNVKIVESTVGSYVNPAIVAKLAEGKISSGSQINKPLPFYLKPPDVKIPNKVGSINLKKIDGAK